jgi:hypothetical protein
VCKATLAGKGPNYSAKKRNSTALTEVRSKHVFAKGNKSILQIFFYMRGGVRNIV